MSTIRVSKDRNYSVINNTVLNDERLSWRAKGIAAYLLSKPDDWSINSQHLWKLGTEGRDAVRNAMAELEAAGYLHRRKIQDKSGKWSTETVFTETPEPENQASVFQSSENQSSVFQALILNTEVPSTEVLSTDQESDQGEGSKIVAAPPTPTAAPAGRRMGNEEYDHPPTKASSLPTPVAKPPAPRQTDGRKFVGGYIPAGKGATPVEVWYESFSIQDNETRLSLPDEDDLRNCTDLAKLRQIVTTFRQCSFKRKKNIRLILDWYRDGIPTRYTSAPTAGGNGFGLTAYAEQERKQYERTYGPDEELTPEKEQWIWEQKRRIAAQQANHQGV